MDGEFTYIVCKINPEKKPNMRVEPGKKVLYGIVLKAIYVIIESTLHWYELYTTILEYVGLKLNPYKKCVSKPDEKWESMYSLMVHGQ